MDLNGEVIDELKRSDFFLFVNFRREALGDETYRGSLFTNQELAIAYVLGFEKMLFLNQAGVRTEGMLAFMVSNLPEFQTGGDALAAVQRAVHAAGWLPSYSRNLIVSGLRWGPQMRYRDHTGERLVQVLYADIVNARPDLGAFGTVARLTGFTVGGQRFESPDKSHLKATAFPGYEHDIPKKPWGV